MNMITPEEITSSSPVKAWTQHRFVATLKLPKDKSEIRYTFDLPMELGQKLELVTPKYIAEKYGALILDAFDLSEESQNLKEFQELCEAASRELNDIMKETAEDVVAQLRVTTALFLSLLDKRWTVAMAHLDVLEAFINKYSDQAWLYEWPEWIKKVRKYIYDNMSGGDKQIHGDSA